MPRYPFSPERLDALPEELAELFRGLELKLLEEICSRLNIADRLNEVTVQDIRALRAHGINLEEIKKAISDTTGTGADKLEKLLDDVVERNQAYYTELVDLADVTAPERMVDQEDIWAIYEQTKGTYRNITQSMGFLVWQGRHRVMLPSAKAYQWALDSALLQVQSGAVSYDQAIREAVRELAEGGLKTVSYESGHVDQVDVAVRRAVMTGVNQLNQKYRERSMDYLETDLVEVTAHSGARDVDGPNGWENHKKWQGKVYRWKSKPRTSKGRYSDFERICGYGSVTGIGGANCRHSYWPFIEGVSERTYTDKELENIDPPPVEFEGRRYTAYEATQKQRQIERTIRKQKRLKTAFQEAGLTEDVQAANARLRRLNEKYRQFNKAAGLPEQRERMKVSYVDDVSLKEAARRLEKRAESGIMKDIDFKKTAVTEDAIHRIPRIQPDGWSEKQAEHLQQAHKDLLRLVKGKPVGTEAGAIYTPDIRLIERRVGKGATHQVFMPHYNKPHVLIHNHPSGEIFSHTDLVSFAMNGYMQTITAVGNTGNVYMLMKTNDYDGFRFLQAYNEVLQQLKEAVKESNVRKYIEIMESFLEGAGKYGAQFIQKR